MTKIEDFENAPVGATATHCDGSRAMKMGDIERRWVTSNGVHLDDGDVESRGYTRDPLWPTPTTAREALDLAWELAYPVKEGQVIPEGVRLLDHPDHNYFSAYTTQVDFTITAQESLNLRTLDPLPDPEPDWLDAPAAFARCGYCSHEDYGLQITLHGSVLNGQKWECAECQTATDWSNLRDVTPLYPKGQDA